MRLNDDTVCALTLFAQTTLSSYSDSNWRIDWSDLRMGKCIGRGGFGEVDGAAIAPPVPVA